MRNLASLLLWLVAALAASAKPTLSVAAAANLVYALETLNAEFRRTNPDVTVEPATGNADLGFVAMSLVLSSKLAHRGHWHEVPIEAYAAVPLDHVAVLTKRGTRNSDAKRYLDFLTSEPARKILREFGYGVP